MDAKIQKFIATLVDEFQMDETRLNAMWKTIDTPVTTKEEEMTCWHTFTKGTKNGERCSKVVKKGGLCTAHRKKKVVFACSHTFNRGNKRGERCSVKVDTENGRCSKHTTSTKLSLKKWEAIVLSQIPEQLVEYYTSEKEEYLDDSNLTRATANNVAAWILVKHASFRIQNFFEEEYADFTGQMRDALDWSSVHPAKKMAEYFDDTPVPAEGDAAYAGYMEYKAEYECAKKVYASQQH